MHFEVVHPGSNAMIVVKLDQGESVKAEAGAMVAKSDTVTVEGKMEGGLGKAVKRFMLGGERFFFQTLKAESGPGEVLIAPATPGDIQLLDMGDGQDYFLQGGAFLAAIGDISIDTKMQKLSQALFSGEGLFVLHCTGKGTVAASAFGAVYQIVLPAGQDYIVDNGHLVAWSGDTNYAIEKAAKGWLNTITSGEGLVCRFSGPGKIWLQTRNPQSFGAWIRSFVPTGA
ncbi:MAG TPA: TIGR00266 family protein [Candidatus Obscuribacterales bacterium]